MPPLPSNLRKDLEKAVIQARDAAEAGATAALQVLAVDVDRAFDSMSEAQKAHRTALRARMRALAPTDTAHGGLTDPRPRGFGPLVEEVAYEQWHRMLFARFLAESDLLIHPVHGISVSLEECAELATSEGEPDEWMVAAKFASAMLPGIFRRDDPSAQVRFAADGRAALERILKALPAQLFLADDALGWVYQFWQTKAKDEVNNSGRKVGGKDLAAVTQLFTEHYMVRFLLENSLGAWWAARYPGSPLLKEWEYLRFRDDGTPAAGAFAGWPATAAEVTVMDPCCGSGHFLVAAADMLRKMRIEEEGLTEPEAAAAVLRDNLFGLELDPRCTQIAVFALAFDAWKHGLRPPAAGGTPVLPNVACCGISVGGQLSDWTRLAGDDRNLRLTLERLYELFKDAPDLGSLINPNAMDLADRMFLRRYDDVADLVESTLSSGPRDPAAAVVGLDLGGVARSASLLARRYTLVATNVPYLGAGNQGDVLKQHIQAQHPDAKTNLATAFVARCGHFVDPLGTYCVVSPHNWLFQTTYLKFRRHMLQQQTCCHLTRLGSGAFATISGEIVNVTLGIWTNVTPRQDFHDVTGINAVAAKGPAEKASKLQSSELLTIRQLDMLRNPDSIATFRRFGDSALLSRYAKSYQGVFTGDEHRFLQQFWESPGAIDGAWERYRGAPSHPGVSGCDRVIRWEWGQGALAKFAGARIQGSAAWGKRGVTVAVTAELWRVPYLGEIFDGSAATVAPIDPEHELALAAYLLSDRYVEDVREVDWALSVTESSLTKVPFDLSHWQTEAQAQHPTGLAAASTEDATQWLFAGNVLGSDAPLQVAIGRLLGYRWPEQTADVLDELVDNDGIVCLPALQGEREGAERLRAFLAAAYGEAWAGGTVDALLANVGYAGKSLEQWLRDGFFEQHCAGIKGRPGTGFHHRPFIWQIWDGRRDGFSALLNYHKLDGPKLQKLAYTYLGAWLERQRDEKARNVPGADDRLTAAQALQRKLALILEGEPPYDIYVRWKKLHEQPVGWDPDLDDGVRLNIRPFMEAGVLRWKPNIKWGIDRGKNPDGSARNNDVHLTIAEKQEARRQAGVGR
ncbi:MAG: hypothetical protein IT303_13060 [Dehalococcoidia bacterium]|nr:hypothetical protein [Dehalococcoidia bacterium]